MIKLWAFEFNYMQAGELGDLTNSEKVQQTFSDTMDRLSGIEAVGFEGAFFSEHHFINALSPTPNLFVAALSQRTKKLRMGVMGNVLPFHQPWRLAEEIGMLDYLTQGRLEIGMSSGVPPEFTFVNIPQADVRPMYSEVMAFLELAFKDEVVTFKGKYFDFEDLPILPRLRPEARRRKWVTLYSPATARNAAEHGYKICTAYQAVAQARLAVDAYFERSDELGVAAGPDDIGIRRQVLICDTDREAEEIHPKLLERSQKRMAETFATLRHRLETHAVGMSEGVKQSGVMDAAAPARTKTLDSEIRNLVSMEDEFIYGSPTTVAEKIIDQCRRLGGQNFMAYHSSSLTRAQVQRMYGELWPKVMPILKAAQISRSAA